MTVLPNVIKAGDVVRLNSGGPIMTVTELDGTYAWCCWFNAGATVRDRLPVVALHHHGAVGGGWS